MKKFDKESIIILVIAFIFVICMAPSIIDLVIDKKNNPEKYEQYQITCVDGTQYIVDMKTRNVPLVPNYNSDGTIKTCGG